MVLHSNNGGSHDISNFYSKSDCRLFLVQDGIEMIYFYEINQHDNLTHLGTPCVIFLRNNNNYYFYKGWYPPCEDTRIDTELGEFIKEYWKNK